RRLRAVRLALLLVSRPGLGYRAATFIELSASSTRGNKRHETRPAPRLSLNQGDYDRRHRVHHPYHLGQAGRHAASRHRSEVASGLDRRSAAAARSRRAALPLPEKVPGPRAEEIAPP